jgi:DNA-binding NarL/FixJ family response regulator
LVCLLKAQPDFEVIGEFSEGFQLMELPGDLSPDVIITDQHLPTINNVEPTSLIHQWNPNQRVLVLSDSTSPVQAIRALRNGSLGYVVRMDDFDQLTIAIRMVFQGRRYVSSRIVEEILNAVIEGKAFEKEIDERISTREKEILQLTAEGKTTSEIGTMLDISTRTVETHRTNIMRKLGLSSQTDIVRYAFKNGLIQVE